MKMLSILFLGLLISSSAFSSTNILFLGDSLTEGQGVDENQAFPRLVEQNLRERKHDVIVTNGGVSGSTSASGVTRLKWHLKKKTDIMVLELGANDGLRGLKITETQKNLKEIIRLAKNKKVKVLLVGVLMPPNYGKKYTDEFEQMYKKIAVDEKIPFLPFILNGVAGKNELNQADGIHPNPKGHEIVAGKVTDFVEKNL
ncbi:MAG: arylesterase [Rhizobacter sp.]|nr:arylesterase [Bacteriovorax sp.]